MPVFIRTFTSYFNTEITATSEIDSMESLFVFLYAAINNKKAFLLTNIFWIEGLLSHLHPQQRR